MKKPNIFHYWMVLAYLGALAIFYVVSCITGYIFDTVNVLGFSVFLTAEPTALMVFEPLVISSVLLLWQYRRGDLQSGYMRAFFAGVISVSYYLFLSASYFCIGDAGEKMMAMVLGMPGIFFFLSLGDRIGEPLLPFLFMLPNTVPLFFLIGLILNNKAAKKLREELAIQQEVEKLGQLGRQKTNNGLPQKEFNVDDQQ